MSTRVRVWCLFIGSAICLVIQIVQELTQPAGMRADATWGGLGLGWSLGACLLLACQESSNGSSCPLEPPPRQQDRPSSGE